MGRAVDRNAIMAPLVVFHAKELVLAQDPCEPEIRSKACAKQTNCLIVYGVTPTDPTTYAGPSK